MPQKIFERAAEPDRRHTNRRQDEGNGSSLVVETMKILFPIVLAWGIAYLTAKSEAVEAAKTEIAVVKATEQLHFDEIQRTLKRLDEWITRQESSRPGR